MHHQQREITMTKKEYRVMRADWQLALKEGRIVRYAGFLTSYPTVEAAQAAMKNAHDWGCSAEIAKVA